MKKMFSRIVLGMALVATLVGCSRVEPNHVGVLMENHGANGINDFKHVTGRVATWQYGTQLYLVPTSIQNQEMGKESLKAADNTQFFAQPVYSFSVDPTKAKDVLFKNYTRANVKENGGGKEFLDTVAGNILKPRIKDIMSKAARGKNTEDLMTSGGTLEFEKAVQAQLTKEFADQGLILHTFASYLSFSESVTKRIDNRNEVSQEVAVVTNKILKENENLKLAQAEAATNKALSEGLTDRILRKRMIDRWDGKLPAVMDKESFNAFMQINK